DSDARLLAAVATVRAHGATWADLAAAAARLRDRLGDEPPVTRADLERVAAAPDAVPAGFTEHFDLWQLAVAERKAAEIAADQVQRQDPEVPDDTLVEALARVDQEALWSTHAQLTHATAVYEEAAERFGTDPGDVDPEIERDIEVAHHEVVRCQRRVEERSRPGAIAAGALAASTLLSMQLGVVAAGATLALALAAACWLVLIPRRRLSAAVTEENVHLRRAGAATWLGVHLRRLEGPVDATAHQLLEDAANARAAAEVDWQDLVGPIDPDAAGEREAAIRSHAVEIDPVVRAERIAAFHRSAEDARSSEQHAARTLTEGLDAYDIGPDVPTGEVRTILAGRIAAGRVARDWRELYALDESLRAAAVELDHLLTDLGFHGDDLEERLARVIDAVSRARSRRTAANDGRDRTEIEAELRALEIEIAARQQSQWIGTTDPIERPADAATLETQRRDLLADIGSETRPDVMGAQRRYDLMVSRVGELERQLGEGPAGLAPLHKRLIARVARTTWQGGVEESVPILLDDPLTAVPVDQRCDLLDMLVRLSDKTQIVYLTGDPVVTRWARQRAVDGSVMLLEPESEDATV
ncbi:MAG: hypothetical protein JWM05_1480, partial [Acidimicrobiales bacterium]|nr:hypothetical protein [Acidimicrobiales bacterium]